MDKDPIMCYIRFMNCEWSESVCRDVFADAPCGWEHLWAKWEALLTYNSRNSAMVEYYANGLDSDLRGQLSAYAVSVIGK